jgi:hypothetical protein
MAMTRSVVATGLRIKGSEIFTGKKLKWQKAKGKIQTHLPFALCYLPFEIALILRSALLVFRLCLALTCRDRLGQHSAQLV